MDFRASGDTGLTVVLGDAVNTETSARVLNLRQAIEAAELPGVVEIVPSYLSLLVHYDPLETSQAALKELISALADADLSAAARDAVHWSFPICFKGEDFAPDLDTVAVFAGLSTDEVVWTFLTLNLYVYMIGFAPGQPYMGDLPEALAIPRRKTPVLNVPKGAVLTATGKSVIYPNANPTGWYIVGRTPIPLFDKSLPRRALLSAGDHVRFHQVGIEEFREIEARLGFGGMQSTMEFVL